MFESNFENMFERTVLFEMLTLIHVCFIILLQHTCKVELIWKLKQNENILKVNLWVNILLLQQEFLNSCWTSYFNIIY